MGRDILKSRLMLEKNFSEAIKNNLLKIKTDLITSSNLNWLCIGYDLYKNIYLISIDIAVMTIVFKKRSFQ